MARELMPTTPDARDLSSHDAESEQVSGTTGGSFKEVFGAFYAAVTGFAIGGLEALSDRRAEARALRLRQRASPGHSRRLRGRAKRGSLG